MARFSCWCARSSLKPLRSVSRKKSSLSVPSLVAARLWQMARTSGALALAWQAKIDLAVSMSPAAKLRPVVGELDVGVVHRGQAEHLGGAEEGRQVLAVELEQPGQLGAVALAAVGGEDLEQAGHRSDRGVG